MATIVPGGNESVEIIYSGGTIAIPLVVGFDESADHPTEMLNDGNMINAGYKYDVTVTSADAGTTFAGNSSEFATALFNKGRLTDATVLRVTKSTGASVEYLNPSFYAFDVPNVGDGENTKVVYKFTAVGAVKGDVNTFTV